MPFSRKRSNKSLMKAVRAAKRAKHEEAKQTDDESPPVAGASAAKLRDSSARRPITKHQEGFRLLDLGVLEEMLKELRCSKCSRGRIRLTERSERVQGLATFLELNCSDCKFSSTYCSSRRLQDSTYEVNLRAVQGCTSTGMGLSKLQDIMCSFNHPKPFSRAGFSNLMRKVLCATKAESESSMNVAAAEVKSKHVVGDESVAECNAMFDGTWQRRGHVSRNGVVSCISVDNVKVLDVEAMSSFCLACKTKEKLGTDSIEYQEWYAGHEEVCSQNHKGSAGSMEPTGVLRMFERSREKRQLEYTGYVGDGDSKSFVTVRDKKVYGEKGIKKKECVGHVQKRCGKRLRDLKRKSGRSKLSDGKTMGGRGRLTDNLIDHLQTYYGLAIRRNKGNAQKMKDSVWATLDHMASTDEHPQHDLCPKGEGSWCRYRVNEAMKEKGECVENFKHKPPMPEAILEKIKPVYESLTDESLLERCVDGYTQNACESFNNMIWNRCPKERFCGHDFLSLAVCNAVCVFNDGRISNKNILGRLGIVCGQNLENFLYQRDFERVTQSVRQAEKVEKKKRQSARRLFKDVNEHQVEAEGVSYETGAF